MKIIAVLFLALVTALTGCQSKDNTIKTTIEPNYEAVSKKDLKKLDVYFEKDDIKFSMYEPQNGCYLGAYVLQDKFIDASMDKFDSLSEKKQGIYTFNLRMGEPFPLSFVLECYSKGRIPHIIIYPLNNYSVFNEDNIEEFAKEFGNLNIPMFVQFYPNPLQYGVSSNDYISYYKKTRKVFKKYAPNTAFIWSIDFKNINEAMEYYPGDDFVDWAGINIYKPVYENNELFSRDIYKSLDYFYYSFQSRKPIIVSQFGVSHYSTVDHKYRVQEAADYIESFYSRIHSDYPRVKAVIYMDYNNINISPNNTIRDNYTISEEEKITKSYRNSISDDYFLPKIESGSENNVQFIKSPFKAIKDGNNLYINLKTYKYDLNDYSKHVDIDIDGESYVLLKDTSLYEENNNKIILKR